MAKKNEAVYPALFTNSKEMTGIINIEVINHNGLLGYWIDAVAFQ